MWSFHKSRQQRFQGIRRKLLTLKPCDGLRNCRRLLRSEIRVAWGYWIIHGRITVLFAILLNPRIPSTTLIQRPRDECSGKSAESIRRFFQRGVDPRVKRRWRRYRQPFDLCRKPRSVSRCVIVVGTRMLDRLERQTFRAFQPAASITKQNNGAIRKKWQRKNFLRPP